MSRENVVRAFQMLYLPRLYLRLCLDPCRHPHSHPHLHPHPHLLCPQLRPHQCQFSVRSSSRLLGCVL